MDLWNIENSPQINFHPAKDKKTNATIICFPGGGYRIHSVREGNGYAEYFAENFGMNTFDVTYRLAPNTFPTQLLDARRSVRYVRAHAEEFGIDPNRIAVIGSSAGGHLVGMLSTYFEPIEGEGIDEIDEFDYLPNAQATCYAVLSPPDSPAYSPGSYEHLFGKEDFDMARKVSPVLNVTPKTPQAFIWHTTEDDGVNVMNSYEYATALKKCNVPVEMHIFPFGGHAIALAQYDKYKHVSQWLGLFKNWLNEIGFFE